VVLRLRELLLQTTTALMHELRPDYPAEVEVVIVLHPGREANCWLRFPSERQ
jgi:hypothetical protein